MKSVLGFMEVEYTEKKSRFIGIIYHVKTVEEINAILDNVKVKYPNANHYTYAYILDDFHQKYNDDGEPNRTAGYPILEVIKTHELNDCLVVVVRYFGGILLGAGGLIRAYSHTAALAVKAAIKTKKITAYTCKVSCDYDFLGGIDKIIREQTNLEKIEYGQKIEFYFRLNEFNFLEIKDKLFNHNNYQDLLEILEENQEYVKIDY